MLKHYVDGIKKYAVFSGRTGLQEFWQFILLNMLINAGLYLMETYLLGMKIRYFSMAYSALLLLPLLAATVRRLRDTGRSGWWVLIAVLPVAGIIALAVFLMSDSKHTADSQDSRA